MNSRLTERPNVRPDALGWAQDWPHGALIHLFGRAQFTQKRGLFLVQWSLQRHEGHETSGLRIVQRGKAVLIPGVHIDTVGGEFPDDLLVSLADGVVQRRAPANLFPVVDQGGDIDVRTSVIQDADQFKGLRLGGAACQHRSDGGLAVGHMQVGVGAVLQQQFDHL